jgi:putative acyl-CoA dehydrogenase
VNYYTADTTLVALLKDRLAPAALDNLTLFGELCAGPLNDLVTTAHREDRLPKLQRYDRWGERIDEIDYCAEQLQARRLALQSEVLPPTGLIERMTKAYLLNQNGEGGITCPLAMTDGLIQLLEAKGSAEQKKRYLPLLHDADGATPLTGGQMVTEKQGGSNVSENETAAVEQPDGSWRLSGLKWFCSNPGDLWVTTAKPKGANHIGLFLMPRHRPDGSLNSCHIQRLKNLSGTRGKATAEIEFKDAYAELLGRTSQGLALLLGTVLRASRIHVAAASLGIMRRAITEAETFAAERIVLGKPVASLEHISHELGALRRIHADALYAFFTMLDAIEAKDPAAEVLVPLLKIEISKRGTDAVRRARLILGGSGTITDFSPLPRLAEDALIQEIWEGTHPILAGHVARALKRPRSQKAFLAAFGAPAQAALEPGPEQSARAYEAVIAKAPSIAQP